jgi:hypothetical protein
MQPWSLFDTLSKSSCAESSMPEGVFAGLHLHGVLKPVRFFLM